ncbi:MAG: MFS transporter, partial [Oscillospiraceae bacterium]|nr:MFS transporter [Oscillospiraceae bacterium]
MKTLTKSIKRVWGISEVGFSVMATMEMSFFVFFLTDVAKLPIGITGAITGSTAIIDAISAIIAGIVIDKVNLKSGKYRPWLVICPPIVTASFVLMFTKIGSNTMAAAMIMIGYIISHFVWNITWTANRNLIPVLTDDQNERSFLSSRIAAGSAAGSIIAAYLVPALSGLLIAALSGVGAYTVIAVIACIIFWICYYIHYFVTKGYDNEPVSQRTAVTFKEMGKAIVGNGNLIA